MRDNWDDWFKFETLFQLYVFDALGERHDIGAVKIGHFGMTSDQRKPKMPSEFAALGKSYFSLGQDDSYYEELNRLGEGVRDAIFSGLRDVAVDLELFERARAEDVMQTSLLRNVSPLTVRTQFNRLARGDARLTPYNFSYHGPASKDASPPITLTFEVAPESTPPTNLHVIIGRNGVGKTRLLRFMSRSLVDETALRRNVGFFASDLQGKASHLADLRVNANDLFANVVFVTFSAFDPFQPIQPPKDGTSTVRYTYIGLQHSKTAEGKSRLPKSPRILRSEFVASVRTCRSGAELGRWRRALLSLEADALFKEADVTALAAESAPEDYEEQAKKLFDRLSSGHKIVLLTMTRLVETADERTLVLLDEPEAHLHPPLLSAFVRALSDLLVQRNGVAIIATHSPVVVQEVPSGCVWKLRRSGAMSRVERPEIETFGENVGVLSREIFGLELTDSGFHRMLRDMVASGGDYTSLVARFGDQLGTEAHAILRALIATRDNSPNG